MKRLLTGFLSGALIVLLNVPAGATTPPPPEFFEGMTAAERTQVFENIRHLMDPVTFEEMQAVRRKRADEIRNGFGKSRGDKGYSLNLDRNGDGAINELDILELGYLTEDRTLALDTGRSRVPSHGNVAIPGFRVDFTDEQGDYANHTAGYFNTLFSDDGDSGTNSMREYFREVSFDTLFLDSEIWDPEDGDDTTSGWFNYPHTVDYVNENSDRVKNMVREAIVAADPDVDYSQFDSNNDGYVDMVSVIYAGDALYDTNLNPHQSTLSDQYETDDGVTVSRYTICAENDGMGTFSHEFGHTMGLPDLYDVDGSSDGIGLWGIMGTGGHLGSPPGSSPAHFTAWEKIELGWVIPRYVTSETHDVSLDPWATTADCLKVWTGGVESEEYFLVTYRRKVGMDSALPGEGILITHIDDGQRRTDNQDNADDTHRLVDVEEADGLYELDDGGGDSGDATDTYYSSNPAGDGELSPTSDPDSDSYEDGPTKVEIYNFSDKGGATMTCDIQVSDDGAPRLSISGPTDGSTVSGTVTISATTNPSDVDNVAFYIDGDLVVTDGESPYEYSWDTGSYADFRHEIRCVASKAGKKGSDTHTVFVKTDAVFPFSDLMESGDDKWTVFDYSGGGTETENAFWQLVQDDSQEGSWSFRFRGPDQNDYPTFNEYDMLVSDPIDLSGSTQPKLTFWHKYKVPWEIDYLLTVDVSDDNGDTWITELEFTYGEELLWTEQSKILDSYAGVEIRIRFRIQSDFGGFTGTPDGWWIDNLSVYEGSDTEPTVSLTLPGPLNPRLSGPLAEVSADASDDDAIDRVEFYVDETLVGTDYSDPYSVTFDSGNLPDGEAEVEARAYDSAEQTASDFMTAVIDNEGDLPPYDDDFENGMGKWWVRDLGGGGIPDTFDQGWWHTRSGGRLSPNKAYMGGDLAWIGGYPPGYGENDEMTSYYVSFSGVDNPGLTFWHQFVKHADDENNYREITGQVRVSTDEGQTWDTPRTYEDTQITSWTEVIVDLSAYEGESLVLIQFRLYSESGGYVSNQDRWFIDDVTIDGDVFDPPPSAPTGLTAMGLSGQVWLEWNDNSEPDFSHYDVYRATSISGPYSKINVSDVLDSEYMDEAVANGTTYWYRIKAVDDGGHESGWSNTAEATPTFSNPPSITIIWPEDGGYVPAGVSTVTVDASDPEEGIERVRFFIDGDLKSTVTNPPYEYALDTSGYSDGQELTIMAEVRDDHWLTDEDSVSATVDKVLPSLTFPNPDDGHGLSALTTLTADASDSNGIDRVEFRLDGVLQSSDESAPYEWDFDAPALGNGTYAVRAAAFDPAGNKREIENNVHASVLDGDANGDGTVDELDVSAIAMLWDTSFGEPGYLPYVDCNHDEVIDERDVGTVGYNFGQS